MSPRTLLVLMVLFVGLGTFAIFDPLRRKEKAEREKDKAEHVALLEGKRLEKVTIRGRHPLTVLVCALKEGCPFDGTGEWRLDQPLEGKGDPSAAGTLASTLLNLRHHEKIDFAPGQPDAKEFGFDQPAAEVTLQLKGEAAPLTLRFGKAAAVGPNVYLSSSGSPSAVFLVPNYLPDMVNKEPFHWQSKRLFPGVEASAFTRLGWTDQKAKPVQREVRALKVNGQWRLLKPVAGAASHVMMEGLASTIAYAAAKSVWSPWRGTVEAKQLLKGKPELELVFAAGESGHVLQLYPKPSAGRGPKELIAVVDKEPAMLAVDASTFDRFRKRLEEYRQRSLLGAAERGAVAEARLVFVREKHEATFRLEGEQWKQTKGEQLKEPLSQARMNAFLDALRDADFQDYLPKAGSGTEAKAWRSQAPDLTIELKDGKGQMVLASSFVVHNRGVAITEAEGELRTLGVPFLKQMPARVSDLGESANKQVVTSDDKAPALGHEKGGAHGNDGNGNNDPHAGHAH